MKWNIWLSLLLIAGSCSSDHQVLFIEAESFAVKGGWVVDQQFMDIMGSPYLMAHGIGKPVPDAVKEIDVPEAGEYKIWVRTKNWTAPFTDSPSPGIFQIKINNELLPFVFGRGKAGWHWEKGGTVILTKGKSAIGLKDLTGFNGRIDAILFTSDLNYYPPEDPLALKNMRRKWLRLPDKPPLAGNFDLVVVGGGIAGICTSVTAARLGLKVALIQNRPVLGGNNSSEIRVILNGKTQTGKYPALGRVVMELESQSRAGISPGISFEDSTKLNFVKAEKNISLFLNYHVFAAKVFKDKIVDVPAKNIETGKELLFKAPLFTDCTGDANLAYLSGADYREGSESKAQTGESRASEKESKQVLGASLFWQSRDAGVVTSFPECPWAYQFTEESCQHARQSSWNWESGFFQDMILDLEEIRDNQLRAIFGNWAFQKNCSIRKNEYARMEIAEMAYIIGKRESRRMLGDIIISQQDIDLQTAYPDGCVEINWGIDLHYPDPVNSLYFPGNEFRAIAIHPDKETSPPFSVPYRCFYSRNINNLFMAGRHISTTHVAHAATRVQRYTGTYGEVVGIASSLCKKYKTTPRGLYESHLPELKEALAKGVPPAKSVHFSYTGTDNRNTVPDDMFKGLSPLSELHSTGELLYSFGDNRRALAVLAGIFNNGDFTETGYYELDGNMNLEKTEDQKTAGYIREKFVVPEQVVTFDEASVLIEDDPGRRRRLPSGSPSFASLHNESALRLCREVVTERDLFHCAGTFYELPANNADGFAMIRPVASHNYRIHDYASFRGMLIMTGIDPRSARGNPNVIISSDGKATVWAGVIDDLWKMGKPVGEGGPWKNSQVVAGTPSDPYLIGFYDKRHLQISHNSADTVLFKIEVEPMEHSPWMIFEEVYVAPGKNFEYTFPDNFQARWVRFCSEKNTRATAWLTYE